MRRVAHVVIGMALSLLLLMAGALVYLRSTGLATLAQPGTVETRLARAARRFAIPPQARALSNPVPASAEVVASGMAHYADHCASCHANDGSGATEIGRGFYPPAPDMRLPATQDLSDGELFHVIERGIRFTACRLAPHPGRKSRAGLVGFSASSAADAG